jgi:hypothetical protein
MIQDDDPRLSDVRSASVLSDHASPARNINAPVTNVQKANGEPTGTKFGLIAMIAAPNSITGKAMAVSIGFIKGNPRSNNFFHLL